MRRTLLAVTALLALPLVALAEAPARAKPYTVGETVADFSTKDLDGADLSLASLRNIAQDKALEAVKAAAAKFGGKDAKPEDSIDSLPGVKRTDGSVDPALRIAFLKQAGRPFGLVAGPKSTGAAKTLGDVSKWITGSASAPLVFMAWSPNCPVVKMYSERIAAMFADTGARLIPIAANTNDSDADIRTYLDAHGYPFRVVVDREQKVCDLFGGERTPHAFLLDAKNVLRYAGAIDNDEKEEMGAARQDWLKEAIVRVAEGKGVDVLQTSPKG